jgi:hypothetical protein
LALLLCLTLFLFWFAFGFAVLIAFIGRRNIVRAALLAPGAGVALLSLPLFWLNRIGAPVERFGVLLTLATGATALALLVRARPRFPVKRLAPFAIVLIVALVLTGYPLLLYGFDWLSYANDDMANYVSGAHHFLRHGFYEIPDEKLLVENRESSLAVWFMYAFGGVRYGSDLLLAWVIANTGLSGPQAYMPVMVALNLALICAAAGLVRRTRRHYTAAFIAAAMLALSALNALGAVYQLIAQVYGLTILTVSAALLLRRYRFESRRHAFTFVLLAGWLSAALVLVYSEAAGFLVLALALYKTIAIAQRRERALHVFVVCAGAALVAAASLSTYVVSAFLFVLGQLRNGSGAADPGASLFPYYLIPSGLANLWGFAPIGAPMPGAALDFGIVAGALLLACAAAATLWQARRLEPAACMSAVMLAMGALLFSRSADFGLFKLAMYAQPFVLSSLALAASAIRPRRLAYGALAAVAFLGLPSQVFYVWRSCAAGPEPAAGFLEIPRASSSRLLSELIALRQRSAARSVVISDTGNVVLGKLEMLYLNPASVRLPLGDARQNLFDLKPSALPYRFIAYMNPQLAAAGRRLLDSHARSFARLCFDMQGAAPFECNHFAAYQPSKATRAAGAYVLESLPAQTVLNRRSGRGAAGNIRLRPLEDERNRLVFVSSELGGHYFLSGVQRKPVGLYPLEPDYFSPSSSMAATGRYLLFRVLQPDHGMRLVLDYTASLNADGENRVPPAAVIGDQAYRFQSSGRGSARLFSPPLRAQTIAGRDYLLLDLGTQPVMFPNVRHRLMRLYGRDVRLDPRKLIGFARDISLISDREYTALAAPSKLTRFPADLFNPELEYSGIYEDGWLSENAYAVLTQQSGDTVVRFAGAIPYDAAAEVLIDGRVALKRALQAGNFDVCAAVEPAAGRRRVSLRFDRAQRLAAPDTRLATARLSFLGFTRSSPEYSSMRQ